MRWLRPAVPGLGDMSFERALQLMYERGGGAVRGGARALRHRRVRTVALRLVNPMRGVVEHLLPGGVERDAGAALCQARQPLLRQVHHLPRRRVRAVRLVVGDCRCLQLL